MFYVYEWVRSDLNLPYYIGKGKGARAYDLKRNKFTDKVTNFLLNNGFAQEIRILAYFVTEDEAFDFEKERIAFWWYLKDHDILTNQTLGGEGFTGGRHTPEFLKKLCSAAKEYNNRPDVKQKKRLRMLGNKSRTGMKDRPETLQRRKASLAKTFSTLEFKIKHSAKMAEVHSFPENKIKHQAACKAAANRPENILRLKNQTGSRHPRAKPVADLTNMVLFETLTAASKYYSLNNIEKVCKGEQKTAGGKIFAYAYTLSDDVRAKLTSAEKLQ